MTADLRPAKPRKKAEFSKRMMVAVMATYFTGVVLGCYVTLHILTVYPDSAVQAFIALLSYIGAPVAVAIGFYSWKAKGENVAKIEKTEGGTFL